MLAALAVIPSALDAIAATFTPMDARFAAISPVLV